ncbi:DUF1740-domain-containing protein [Rozella allomycis CSF55]|uniref:DUF1740-domain-containing protein n=1 Tax=Rozella allomycis (strain CSF55) TaxID=988480 RepID=A0A4P9YP16_ROZAC|nr:DUF1740-domain-containing protein [Rozella allomycis CSF55]
MLQGTYRNEVPSFKRFEGGYVLGLPNKWRLLFNKSTGLTLIDRYSFKSQKYDLFRDWSDNPIPVEKIRKIESFKTNDSNNFIDFGIEWDEILAYTAQDVSMQEKSFTEKQMRLNEKLSEDPQNIDNWIALIDHQKELTNITNLGRYEKQLAICERARKEIPGNEELEVLYLKLTSSFMETSIVLSKFEKALEMFPESKLVWELYLDNHLYNFSIFNFSSCADRELTIHLVDFFNKLCEFVKESGYFERFICLNQALIEFNFFCPFPEMKFKERIEEFEMFWESDEARVGEENARGWNGKLKYEEIKIFDVPWKKTQFFSEHDLTLWLAEEDKRSENYFLPKKASDDNDVNEDPDRTIFFDDVEPFLFIIPDKLKTTFLKSFLVHLGIPINNFLAFNLLNSFETAKPYIFPWIDPLNFDHFYHEINEDLVGSIFLNKNSFWGLNNWIPGMFNQKSLEFVRRILQSISEFDNLFLTLFISLEFQLSKKRAEKILKEKLKKDQSNALLWDIFALISENSVEVYKNIIDFVKDHSHYPWILFHWSKLFQLFKFQQSRNLSSKFFFCILGSFRRLH